MCVLGVLQKRARRRTPPGLYTHHRRHRRRAPPRTLQPTPPSPPPPAGNPQRDPLPAPAAATDQRRNMDGNSRGYKGCQAGAVSTHAAYHPPLRPIMVPRTSAPPLPHHSCHPAQDETPSGVAKGGAWQPGGGGCWAQGRRQGEGGTGETLPPFHEQADASRRPGASMRQSTPHGPPHPELHRPCAGRCHWARHHSSPTPPGNEEGFGGGGGRGEKNSHPARVGGVGRRGASGTERVRPAGCPMGDGRGRRLVEGVSSLGTAEGKVGSEGEANDS